MNKSRSSTSQLHEWKHNTSTKNASAKTENPATIVGMQSLFKIWEHTHTHTPQTTRCAQNFIDPNGIIARLRLCCREGADSMRSGGQILKSQMVQPCRQKGHEVRTSAQSRRDSKHGERHRNESRKNGQSRFCKTIWHCKSQLMIVGTLMEILTCFCRQPVSPLIQHDT